MKSHEEAGGGGSGGGPSGLLATPDEILRALRTQLNRRFALTPCWRATSAIDTPGDSASETIRRFSSSDQNLRDRFGRFGSSAPSNIAFKIIVPLMDVVVSIKPMMDTNPLETGTQTIAENPRPG
jgi:hypothetical protein